MISDIYYSSYTLQTPLNPITGPFALFPLVRAVQFHNSHILHRLSTSIDHFTYFTNLLVIITFL